MIPQHKYSILFKMFSKKLEKQGILQKSLTLIGEKQNPSLVNDFFAFSLSFLLFLPLLSSLLVGGSVNEQLFRLLFFIF